MIILYYFQFPENVPQSLILAVVEIKLFFALFLPLGVWNVRTPDQNMLCSSNQRNVIGTRKT